MCGKTETQLLKLSYGKAEGEREKIYHQKMSPAAKENTTHKYSHVNNNLPCSQPAEDGNAIHFIMP